VNRETKNCIEIGREVLRQRDETKAQLRIAIGHITHMAAFISKHPELGYSFESLGEDHEAMEAAAK
jgi:hypothetical protein